MDNKEDLVSGIVCFLMAIIYLVIAMNGDKIAFKIGFPFWILAGIFWIKTYKNKKRK